MVVVALASFAVVVALEVVVAFASFVGVMLALVKFSQGRSRQVKIKVKFQVSQVESVYVEVHPQT